MVVTSTTLSLPCHYPVTINGDHKWSPFIVTGLFLSRRVPGYSDTGYSDILLTVTLWAGPLFLKCVTVSKYFLTVTLLAGPEGVTVSGYVCTHFLMQTFAYSEIIVTVTLLICPEVVTVSDDHDGHWKLAIK